jgi:hypothetical protein
MAGYWSTPRKFATRFGNFWAHTTNQDACTKVGVFQDAETFYRLAFARCCSLCLLENDPSVIEPDVLSKDRMRFEASGDEKYIDKAHRRGTVGWNVGRRMELAPHYRRRHMALVWTGSGRVVPRRGRVVHREKVEKVPSGFGRELI